MEPSETECKRDSTKLTRNNFKTPMIHIQWNADFSNLQGQRKLVQKFGGKIVVFVWAKGNGFGFELFWSFEKSRV